MQRPIFPRARTRLLEDTKAKMSLDDLFHQIQSGNVKELNIIVKADVQGSVEAVKQSLVKLSNEEVVVKVHPWWCWCHQRVRCQLWHLHPMRSSSDLTYVRIRPQE